MLVRSVLRWKQFCARGVAGNSGGGCRRTGRLLLPSSYLLIVAASDDEKRRLIPFLSRICIVLTASYYFV